MGIAGDSKRGQGDAASKAAAGRRFADAQKRVLDRVREASGGGTLDAEGLAERRDMIAEIAAKGPKKPERIITARDFLEEREAGVEPLDAIFTRDGWNR